MKVLKLGFSCSFNNEELFDEKLLLKIVRQHKIINIFLTYE
jgi:hypothetical protein